MSAKRIARQPPLPGNFLQQFAEANLPGARNDECPVRDCAPLLLFCYF
jgi:hypothetical protein